jgi:hypothetical protein
MRTKLLYFTLSFITTISLLSAKSNNHPQKQQILVIPGEVTIDGKSRPDLGRSFGDSITGKLLQSGAFTIVDQIAGSNHQSVNNGVAAGPGITPEATTKQLAGKTTARYALITRMIAEDDFCKFSIKKLRVADSKVVGVYQASAVSNERSTMFELLDKAMNLLLRDVYQEQARIRRQTRPSIIDIQPSEAQGISNQSPSTLPNTRIAERVLNDNEKNGDPATAKTAKVSPSSNKSEIKAQENTPKTAQYAGRICAVDAKWQFCIIELEQENSLAVDDLLLVHTENQTKPISRLNVSRIEGNKVIAESEGNIDLPSIRPGLKVYRWGIAKKE